MKKKLFTYPILLMAILFSCAEVEEPLIDNPYDPQYESTTAPAANITQSPTNGTEIDQSSASFGWNGTGANASEFAYMLEGVDADYSDWTSNRSVTYNFLDEGDYTFLVKEKHANNEEQQQATSVSFSVNAIKSFALIFEKYFVNAPSGNGFSINLNIEEADDLNGLTTVVNFNSDRITFNSVEAADIDGVDNVEVLEKTLASGSVQLNILLLGTNGGFTGSTSLCKLNFTSNSNSTSDIELDSGSATDLRDENNDKIRDKINIEFREATINE
ncbi:MAG: triple tyrosine motif-containing protein [Salinivirgaceae bacterium]|nr:triple tyrosine motif-containing protein [Salinivirgaceae bacterium]